MAPPGLLFPESLIKILPPICKCNLFNLIVDGMAGLISCSHAHSAVTHEFKFDLERVKGVAKTMIFSL